jgi:desulfoferrodoxin (superoxide reductase-like protein)
LIEFSSTIWSLFNFIRGGYNMSKIGEQFQSADWKAEKHVPVIDCPDVVKADETFDVKVAVGKEVAHPNTTHCSRGIVCRCK